MRKNWTLFSAFPLVKWFSFPIVFTAKTERERTCGEYARKSVTDDICKGGDEFCNGFAELGLGEGAGRCGVRGTP